MDTLAAYPENGETALDTKNALHGVQARGISRLPTALRKRRYGGKSRTLDFADWRKLGLWLKRSLVSRM